MTYNLSVLEYYFCVLHLGTHIFNCQNVKSKQATSMINHHTYDDTTHALKMNSVMPCCIRE